MNREAPQATGCGLDTVEIARVERLLLDKSPEDLTHFFSAQELADAGTGPGRAASLAARFAAKEACCKLFPRETALGVIGPADFAVERDAYGAPCMKSSVNAQAVLDRHRVARLRVSLTHTETSASAIAWADPRQTDAPWFGKLLYHLLGVISRHVIHNQQFEITPRLSQNAFNRLSETSPFVSGKRKQSGGCDERITRPRS